MASLLGACRRDKPEGCSFNLMPQFHFMLVLQMGTDIYGPKMIWLHLSRTMINPHPAKAVPYEALTYIPWQLRRSVFQGQGLAVWQQFKWDV
mmetsp:Transcript_11118/g.19398  ORF Transcript_11118/g.19398 Transcript_11118/m.19398 type:complete len:92 (-) Transcript_11118:403-678(-)